MASYWQYGDGGLAAGNVGAAPTYNDVFTKFLGQDYMTGYDPALAMTLNAGNQGGILSGTGAFLSGRNAMQGPNEGGSLYADDEMTTLAKQMGIDTAGKTGIELQGILDSKLGDYYQIGGMSAGWNPTGDARQGNSTLYQRKDGKLVPIQTQGGHLREEGSFLQEHPGILAPIAVATGGLAYGALAGAGAGAAGGAAAGSAGGAGTAGAAGAGAAGATGAGTAGISGSIANALGLGGWWGGLPAWGQGAITGALQGGVTSGIQGKNILQGALMGGLTGGVGSWGGGALSSATGLPAWASKGLVSAGLGGLSGGWQGALGAGLGSLANTGLGGGSLGAIGSRLTGMGVNAALGGGAGSAGGAGGLGGGTSMAGGSSGASSSTGTGAGGGLAGGWRMPSAAQAAQDSYLKQAYAPIAAEEGRRKLREELMAEV